MIQVTTRSEKGQITPLNFDTNALEIQDGVLIIYLSLIHI